MKTILITGIGGLTPRSIAGVIREKHPDYRLIGCDVDKKAMGFFLRDRSGRGLVDEYYIAPRCDAPEYFPWLEKLTADRRVDYAFVQPEREIIAWGRYLERYGRTPCPVFMGALAMSQALSDKAEMAALLEGTEFIPKTIKVTQAEPGLERVEREIGFPCWIRATRGTGGYGSLRLDTPESYRSWLMIHADIPEFTVCRFLSGRHLANQMLYYEGEYVKGAALECAEYVMASAAPSRVTGNTHFGRFLNEDRINAFCDRCIRTLEQRLGVRAHGVFSFDLKEDEDGALQVTEVNIRHMAYTGVMARAGFDLIEDTIRIMEDGGCDRVRRAPFFHYDKPYVFLRDVDAEPILLEDEAIFDDSRARFTL